MIYKWRREDKCAAERALAAEAAIYGSRSERTARLLLDQMELQLEELEASATEDETTAEMAAAKPPKSPRAARANLSASIYPANG